MLSLFLLPAPKPSCSPNSAFISVSRCLFALPHRSCSFLKWITKCLTIWITTYGMNELSFLFSSWRKKSMSKLAISFTNWLWNFNYYSEPLRHLYVYKKALNLINRFTIFIWTIFYKTLVDIDHFENIIMC